VNASGRDPASLVPHAGDMCLLSRIVSADDRGIVCAATSHASPTNPLRRAGRLAALHLAEYGAQAMAVHGGLSDPEAKARGGMLVAIRDLALHVERLDDVPGELTIAATKLVANADGRIYAFVASGGGRELGRGRVSVMFGAGRASGQ
jgi:predicted hotdog family 3-hydroxylacyl-ACP dehydratase